MKLFHMDGHLREPSMETGTKTGTSLRERDNRQNSGAKQKQSRRTNTCTSQGTFRICGWRCIPDGALDGPRLWNRLPAGLPNNELNDINRRTDERSYEAHVLFQRLGAQFATGYSDLSVRRM
jgi:hypothetical protein